MRTIRWGKTHDRMIDEGDECPYERLTQQNACIYVELTLVDPSDPEDVKGFLTSLGFKRQRGAKDGFDGWNDSIHRWVGPWEPVE